jgi:hypothetical protein
MSNVVNRFFQKKGKKLFFIISIFSFLFFSFIVFKLVTAAISVAIITPPPAKSDELPSTKASAQADPGDNVALARYQIYPSAQAPSGTWRDCTTDAGYTFGADEYVEFSCIVPSLSDGSYKMNIEAVSSDSSTNSVETSAFIVDRVAPVISFDDLPGDPLLINYNNPIFYGDVVDTLTDVVSVEYKWAVASTTSPVPADFGDSGWSACSITGSGTSVSFTCNPGYNFPDSVKGDEYRMHVRATDEVGNLSGNTNYYKFQVDTTPPYNLDVTYPDAAGITLYGNHSYNITWVAPLDAFELGSTPITIEYSTTGAFSGEEVLIIDNHVASGPYSWQVPAALDTSTARIRITATDLAGNSFSSTSANPFTIVPYSAPSVSINSITNDITDTVPINFTASASDPQGIASARYRIDGGAWTACSAQDGVFDETSEILECNNVSVSEGSHTILVEATDSVSDTGSDSYIFIYDNTNPVVDAGTLGTINQPTTPGASATDAHSSIVSRSWVKTAGPGTITFGGGSNITNPSISADVNGSYTAEFTACDLAGHCASDTVSFTWTDEPLAFSVTEPSGGERLAGGSNFLITWSNPGGSSSYTFDVRYSTNGGTNWSLIVADLTKATLSYNWSVPTVNSENVVVKVEAVDTGDVVILDDISNVFAIDSSDPTVDAGEIVGTIISPTAPGASASDNFDSSAELSYSWSSVSGPASVVFTGGSSILNPSLSGTITGSYTARLTVTDRAGNSASDTVSFYYDGNPPDFSVSAPSGPYYAGGGVTPVVWSVSSGTDHYELEYTLNGGSSFNTITASTNGTATSSGLYYNWTMPSADSNQVFVRVTAYDEYDNSASAVSPTFIIDSSAPIVDAGNLDLIYIPTSPGASASDGVGSGISSYAWSQISGPGTISFGGGADILNPLISADSSGVYDVRLTVTDNLGMSSYDEISFYYSIEPPAPVITSPGIEEVWAGLASKNIRWEINDPGDLDNFLVSYSLNDGASWTDINTVASTTRLLNWSVPEENTTEAQVRIVVTDTEGYSATSTRSFNIDSIAPIITIGSIGTTTTATSSGTIVTDNIDSEAQMDFVWNGVGAPAGGTLVFTPTHDIVDPNMAGTVSGEYTAQIVAKDRAGHISSDLMTFYWDGDPTIPIVTSPTSTVFASGGDTQDIDWYIPEDPELDYFELSHSLDNGSSWSVIATTSSSTRTYAWDIPAGINSDSSGSSIVRVKAIDIYSNESIGLSPNFTIDSISPVLNIGTIDSPISDPTRAEGVVASDNLDDELDLTFTWSVLSLPYPEATLTIEDVNATSTYFSGNMSGEYEVMLLVSDRAGNIATSSLAFVWDSEYDPVLISPATGDALPGGVNTDLVWQLVDPGNLTRIEAQYSTDGGESWLDIDNNIATSSRELTWLVPDTINSTSSMARIMTVDENSIKATSTSGLFIIDSINPTVDAGAFTNNVNSPTAPGASASDNIDNASEITYVWQQQAVPRGGVISFSGGTGILNPGLSGSINGDYIARLTVYDRAGNSASDTVSFTRYIGSSGGGGGGGTSSCGSVDYGEWGECYDGVQYRSILNTNPAVCLPTDAQRAAQEQACSSTGNEFCQSVEFGDWGDCVDGVQYREILSREPDLCDLTPEQQAQSQKSCEVIDRGPFDEDALAVMEEARKNFAGTDAEMLKRVTGQILIQVEEYGRAWYVSALDKRRYYLGSPTNAFSVMSLIGLGVKNERLFKLPVGLLEGSLTQDKDTDGDGLPDRLEEGLLTSQFKADSDGDGHSDKTEIISGYNPNGSGKMPYDKKVLESSLGHIYIQVETNGEAWYVEPRNEKRYYLGRPEEAFAIMREFGLGITNEDINKIPVGQFSEAQLNRITKMLEDRKRELEARK